MACGDVTFLGERGNDSTASSGTHFGSVVIRGGPGDDELRGGDERTVLRGGSGRDRLFGDMSPIQPGSNGADVLSGGPGADSLHGMNGRDRLLGGTGIDQLWRARQRPVPEPGTPGARAHSCER